MSKLLPVGIVVLLLAFGFIAFISTRQYQPLAIKQESRKEIPVRLKIPKLGIDANIEKVGLDSKEAMDVPKDYNNVGWYSLGYRPAEKGNAVIAGHYDDRSGNPAVFYHLDSLKVRDEVITVDSAGNETIFIVALIEKYKYDEVPINQVFGDFVIPRLNLITCSGLYDQNSQLYLERTVVYTRLPDEKGGV